MKRRLKYYNFIFLFFRSDFRENINLHLFNLTTAAQLLQLFLLKNGYLIYRRGEGRNNE